MITNFYIHSQTGNTLAAANTLFGIARDTGGTAELAVIVPSSEQETDPAKITISPVPDCSGADLIVIGGPVHGASATAAVRKAISEMTGMKDKPVVLFVTEFFPFAWMGGSRAVKQMEEAAAARGAKIVCKEIIHWKRRDRQKQLDAFADAFRSVLAAGGSVPHI